MAHTNVYGYEIHVNLLNWGNYHLSRAVLKSDIKTDTILVNKTEGRTFRKGCYGERGTGNGEPESGN